MSCGRFAQQAWGILNGLIFEMLLDQWVQCSPRRRALHEDSLMFIDLLLMPKHLINSHRGLSPLNPVFEEQILLHYLPAFCLLPDKVETSWAILHKPGYPLLLQRWRNPHSYLECVAYLMIEPQILSSDVIRPMASNTLVTLTAWLGSWNAGDLTSLCNCLHCMCGRFGQQNGS